MGRNVDLVVAIEFVIKDVEKSKDIVGKFLSEKNQDASTKIQHLSPYISINDSDICITLCSDPDGWEDVTCDDGNFGLYINTYQCWLEPSKIEEFHNKIKEVADVISDKYGISYEKLVIGIYQ